MRRSGIFGIILIAVVLIFFSFGACDLLINKPEIDLEKTMDAEIAWANAPRLTVGLSYPDEWGGSNPPRGTITSLDIRKGFPFDVEFTPSAAYSVLGWRAYRTSALPANWIDNPAAALEGVKQLEEGAVSIAAAGENKSTVTLTISDPVTLIPWCRDQPRIISTDPSLDVPGVYYSPAKTITITFAAPLDGTTVRFGEDYIMIEARNISDGVPTGPAFNVCGAGEGALTWFNAPVYSLRTITIETGSIIPDENVEITVRVGTGITSALSANGMAGAVSFSYRTRSSSAANIDSWTASYDPDANTITVGYTDSQGTADRREAWYSVNGGPVVRTGIEKDEENKRFIIRNVPRLDTEGVRDGMPAGNTAGYRIYLDLYTGGEITGTAGPVNIWNFGTPGISGSGMSVSSYYPAEEISAQEQLAAMELNNADKKYVLANDITLAEGWTPIGTDTEPFQGKFYGNGHRITVTGGTGGIFGKTDGLIRDLTVHYTGAVSGGDNIGGLAGAADSGTVIRNCIVSAAGIGALSGGSYVGGIAGSMAATANIENCRAGLPVSGANYVGGVVGSIGSGGSPGTVNVSGVTAAGNLTVTGTGLFYAGGFAGYSKTPGTIQNVTVSGTITIKNSGGPAEGYRSSCGGIIGTIEYGLLGNCDFAGKLTTSQNYATNNGGLLLGGLIGLAQSAQIIDCTVRGDIDITNKIGAGDELYLGGMAAMGDVNSRFENCEYRDGAITVETMYGEIGGFIAAVYGGTTLTNCRLLARSVTIKGLVQQHYGGFVGVMRGSLSNCYTTAPLYITLTGSGTARNASFIGGFIADFNTNMDEGDQDWTIENCYAAGDVTVQNTWTGYTKALRAGGFIGSMGGWGGTDYSDNGLLLGKYRDVHIKNCYALGNVTVTSNGSGEISAGGFAGIVVIPDANVLEHCFAAGAVLAGATSSGDVYAGGLVGRWRQGRIQNCAARGPSVAAMGKTNGSSSTGGTNVGRVYGYSDSQGGSVSDNYALRDMTLEYADSISTAPAPRPASTGTSGQDGGNVAASLLRSAYFWTAYISFDPSFWDFSGVNRGYPALVGLGGQ